MKEITGHLVLLVINANVQYNRKRFQEIPTLLQSLEVVLKYVSYNPSLAEYISRPKNLSILKKMNIPAFCLDLDHKAYIGAEGFKIQ